MQENIMIDIKISYSTLSFDECDKLYLKIFDSVNSNKNNYNYKHQAKVIISHKMRNIVQNEVENRMAVFRVRACLR